MQYLCQNTISVFVRRTPSEEAALVQGGVNIYEVQKLLGHSDVRTTEIYSHLTTSELQNAVDKITALTN